MLPARIGAGASGGGSGAAAPSHAGATTGEVFYFQNSDSESDWDEDDGAGGGDGDEYGTDGEAAQPGAPTSSSTAHSARASPRTRTRTRSRTLTSPGIGPELFAVVPLNVWQHVFCYLPVSFVAVATLVCRTWYFAIAEDEFWQQLYHAHWGGTDTHVGDWRSWYRLRVHKEWQSSLPEWHVRLRMANDRLQRLELVRQVRQVMCKPDPPIEAVLRDGFLDKLVAMLDCVDQPELQIEVSWVLTNISSSSVHAHIEALIDAGVVERLVHVMQHALALTLVEHAVWIIGNISGDSASARTYVLEAGALDAVCQLLNTARFGRERVIQQNAAWTIRNMCKIEPVPDIESVRVAFPHLRDMMQSADAAVRQDACDAVCAIGLGDRNADRENDRVQTLIDNRFVPLLVQRLSDERETVRALALRACGVVVSGDHGQTQIFVASGGLGALRQLIAGRNLASVIQLACWTVANVCAGTSAQIHEVIDADLLPLLISVLMSTTDARVRAEAALAICNAATGASDVDRQVVLRMGPVAPLCQLLRGRGFQAIWSDILDALGIFLDIDSVGTASQIRQYAGTEDLWFISQRGGTLSRSARTVIRRIIDVDRRFQMAGV